MRPTRAGFTVAMAIASVRLNPATRITFEIAASMRKARSGQARTAFQHHALVVLQFHIDLAQAIVAGRAQRGHHGVGDQHAALDSLGPQRNAQERIRQMDGHRQ